MILFWELMLALSAVNCGLVSENFIIDEQDIDVPKTYNTPFQVYWNFPTKQCRSKKIPFDDLLSKFEISYNKNDKFEGETITIIYNVGLIPAILRRGGEKFYVRNGGLPQEGNLELHLAAFREHVNRLIPDPDFSGIGVLDMEEWRPIFRQHWSTQGSIIDLSLSIEKRQYWWWPTSWQKMEAAKRFEDAARIFMQKTLFTAKQMRPNAVWGYYGFPYCFNMDGNNMVEHCSANVKGENDRIYWLWAESTALYPSIYSNSYLSTTELEKLVKGRLTESNRVKKAGDLVLPYFAITYRDGGFFKEKDTIAVFETLQKKNASGLIIWGASSDVNTVQKCKQLYKYIDSSFGPIAKKYIERINKIQKISETEEDSVYNASTVIAATRTPIYNSIEDNNIIIPTTEKLNNVTHINEVEHQLNIYFYETQDSKTYSQSSTSVPEDNSGHDLNNKTNILLTFIENTNNNTNNNVINKIQKNSETEEDSVYNASTVIAATRTPIYNSIEDNNIIIPTTEKLNNVSLINEVEHQLNIYFYETQDSKTYSQSSTSVPEDNSGHDLNNKTNILLTFIENTNNNTNNNVINKIQKNSETEEDSVYNASTVIAATRTPIYNSIEDNNIIIPTTEKLNNVSHINEVEHQLNIYFYETQDSKTYSQSSTSVPEDNSGHDLNNKTNILLTFIENTNNNTNNNVNSLKQPTINLTKLVNTLDTKMTVEQLNKYYYENNESRAELQNSSESVIWDIITYENSVENENITERNSEKFTKYPVTEYSSTTTNTIYINKTKDNSEKLLITINNSTCPPIETKNDTITYNLDDLIKSSLVINLLNTSVVNNVTESDLELQLIEQKEQLTNYYYETDENKEKLKNSNLSEIWSIIKYETSSENENITDTLRSKQYMENPEPFKYKDSREFTWATTNNNTADGHYFDKEIYLPNNTFHNTEDNISTKNNTTDTLETAAFNLTSTLKTPMNSIAKPENSKTKANEEKYFNDYLITLENDRSYPYKSENGTEIKVYLADLDSASSLEFTYLPPNNKDFSQNVKQEDQLDKTITYPNDKATASSEKVLDYLITPAEHLTNPNKTSIIDSYTRINLENTSSLEPNLLSSNNYWNNVSQSDEQEEQFVEKNIYNNIEAMGSTEINVSEFLAASLINSTNPVSTSIKGKKTEIKLENIESVTIAELYLPSSNNYSNNISKTGIQEQHTKNSSNPNNGENDILNNSITLQTDLPNPMPSNDTEINLNSVDSGSSLEFNLLPSKYYLKDFSQNVNLDEQLLRQTSYSNFETNINRKNKMSDNITTLTVDFINFVNASLNGNNA